jgi:outer membrane protein TolC
LENIPFQPAVYSLEEIYALSESRQEEIRMAEAQVEKAAVQADLARYQNLPEFRVGIFYAAIGSPDVPTPPEDAGQDAVGIQFGVNVPLWFGKNTARTEQAQAELEKTKADKAARIIETRTKIRNLFFRLQNAMRLIQLYRDELLPQASASMELAETWFREGEGSFSDFTETQSALYNFQLSLARARADYGKYLAGLERLAGQNLTEK